MLYFDSFEGATIIAIVNYDDYQQNNATGCNGYSNNPCNEGCNDGNSQN